MKTLVAYFSASGNTKKVAEKINEIVKGDIFEIEPVEKYTDADLDWTSKQSRSTLEMKDLSFRPPVKNKVENLQDYDKVAIGFPIWWYTAPTIINTFIEENELSGKEIYFFCTSGGSSVEKAVENFQAAYPNLKFKEGKTIRGKVDEEEIANWLS